MFTGLIESIGTVRSLQQRGTSATLAVELGTLADTMQLGDSVAINGVCLTVTQLTNTVGNFDVSQETLTKTNIGSLRPAAKVNLERALQLGARLGGHMVQGHVDGPGKITSLKEEQAFVNISFSASKDVLVQVVPKGSIAVNGISLTVATRTDTGFSVAIIPETARATTLACAKIGDTVNLEADIVVKSVQQYLAQMISHEASPASGLTVDKLRQLGF